MKRTLSNPEISEIGSEIPKDPSVESNNKSNPEGEGARRDVRERTQTEKGKIYQRDLAERNLTKTFRDWRKKSQTIESIIADSADLQQITDARCSLETSMDELTAAHDHFIELIEAREIATAIDKYEKWYAEHRQLFKAINQKIVEIRTAEVDDGSSIYSQASRASTRSSKHSAASSAASRRKANLIANAAKLSAALSFFDIENLKSAELKKIQIMKEIAMQNAELEAVCKLEEPQLDVDERGAELPAKSMNADDRINEWLPDARKTAGIPVTDWPSLPINEEYQPIKFEVNDKGASAKAEPGAEVKDASSQNQTTVEKIMDKAEPGAEGKDASSQNQTTVDRSTKATLEDELTTRPTAARAEGNTASPSSPNSQVLQGSREHNSVPKLEPDSEQQVNQSPENIQSLEHTLLRLADLLSVRGSRDRLPLPEPDVFRGDSLQFPKWLKSFETLIEGQTDKPEQRLYYLGRYTAGDAKEAINGLVTQKGPNAYRLAKQVLSDRYGNPFLVATAYRKKIHEWPKIAPNDGLGLRKF